MIADQQRYRQMMQEPGFANLPAEERNYITRRAVVGHYLVIYRTEADPAYLDMSMHAWKSTRKPASIVGARPDQLNYAPSGFGRLVTPRAWLSTWSGSSTRATLMESLKSIHEPLLLINFTGTASASPTTTRHSSTPARPQTRRSGSSKPSTSATRSQRGRRPCSPSSSGSARASPQLSELEDDMQRIVETLELVNGLPDQQAGPAQQAFLATLYEEGTLMFAGPFTTTAVAVPPSRAVTPSRKLGPSTKRVP